MRKFELENKQAGGGCCYGVTGGAKAVFGMLGALFLSGVSENALAQCVATTDCATLGYTESSCPDGGVKCPFGDKWACLSESSGGGGDDADKPGSVNNDTDCTYGSIYYNDGVCYPEAIAGRVPIGVVVYVDQFNGEKWIMSLDELLNYRWADGREETVDIVGLDNYQSEMLAVVDVKSCDNTQILSDLGAGKYPAAEAARNYVPAGGENTAGKWCLPAAGIWNQVNIHRAEIDEAIQKARGTLFSGIYWSSSEYSEYTAWVWFSDSASFSDETKFNFSPGTGYSVRPVMRIK